MALKTRNALLKRWELIEFGDDLPKHFRCILEAIGHVGGHCVYFGFKPLDILLDRSKLRIQLLIEELANLVEIIGCQHRQIVVA